MPSISSMMDIGKWALNTSSRHLDTVSHNVANVNTEGYTRQEVVQASRFPERTTSGMYGTGVKAVTVIQQADKLLLERLTDKASDQWLHDSRLSQLHRLETLANEAGETGLGQEITNFFNAWQDVSNSPQSSAVRQVLLETANNLVGRFNTISQDMIQIERDLDTYLTNAVDSVNDICRRIAELNDQIRFDEVGGDHTSNDLRDMRQTEINKLAELINIDWFEQADSTITIQTGRGVTLVHADFPDSRDPDPISFREVAGYDKYQVVLDGSNVVLDTNALDGGKIGAWLQVRDQDLPDMQEFITDLSRTIIEEVNLLHTQGVGLDKHSDLTGTYTVSDPSASFENLDAAYQTALDGAPVGAVLDDATLHLISQGTVDVWVYESGTRRSYTINVSPSDSLDSLVSRINTTLHPAATPDSSVNPVAQVTGDNELRLFAGSGIEFAFANDTSGVLAALGINTFFDGYSPTSMKVNDLIAGNVRHIAAGRLLADGEHAMGDNRNALELADLKDADTMTSGTETFNESIISWASSLGTVVQSTQTSLQFAETSMMELKDLRDTVSAVNLDEEMVKLIQYQRSYQMAAKMITTADTLLATLLELKR